MAMSKITDYLDFIDPNEEVKVGDFIIGGCIGLEVDEVYLMRNI